MPYREEVLKADLLSKAQNLQKQIHEFMINGKEFDEVKKLYREYKDMLARIECLGRPAEKVPRRFFSK